MQNDNLPMYDELRQMKSDYEYLKADMDKQTIINRQLMEMVFRNNVSVLDSNRKTTIIGVGVAIFATLAVSYIRGIDMRIAGVIATFFLLLLTGYVLIYHRLGKIESSADNVLSTVKKLRKFRKNYMIVNIVSWILAVGIICIILPEIHDSFRIPGRGTAAVAFMCIAALIGIAIQYFIDRKVLKACDDIIVHLKDRS